MSQDKNIDCLAKQLFKTKTQLDQLEDELWNQVCAIIKVSRSNPPFERLTYDSYDDSIEFKECIEGFDLSVDQKNKLEKLGFRQGWICYKNGQQKHF